MKALVIAEAGLRRLVRWRANVFFLLVLPLLVILLLGAAFGGEGTARLGVVSEGSGARTTRILGLLEAEDGITLRRYASERALTEAVARGRVDAGLVIPRAVDGALAGGSTVALRYVGLPTGVAQQLRATVAAATARERARARAAAFLLTRGVGPAGRREALADAAVAATPAVSVGSRTAGGASSGDQRFGASASSQLLLFVFLNALNAAIWLFESRRLGVSRRMLATPTSVGTVVAGELLARLAIALVQALLIVAGAALLFGVDWGDPLGATLVIVAFCLVGAGAGTLLGATARSSAQCGAVALLLGMTLAALGGSMVPLEVFPATMRRIADLTPHAWGNEAFHLLVDRGESWTAVLPQVGVLLGFATVAVALAAWGLRRAITR